MKKIAIYHNCTKEEKNANKNVYTNFYVQLRIF